MARARNIKPALFKNEILGVAEPLYTLLFEGLWMLADREGRLEDRPLRIRGEIFPYREGLDIDGMLDWLQSNGFIRRYEACGKRCILVVEFGKHQNPHKNEVDSVLPAPEQIGANSENIRSAPAYPLLLIPDTGTTDPLIPDTGSMEYLAPAAAQRPFAKPAKTLKAMDLVAEGVDPRHAADWLKVRKDKRAPLTETAWDNVKAEATKAGITTAEAVRISAANSWQGFKAEWMDKSNGARSSLPFSPPNRQEVLEHRNRVAATDWAERKQREFEEASHAAQ
jgi:hypothetical protein